MPFTARRAPYVPDFPPRFGRRLLPAVLLVLLLAGDFAAGQQKPPDRPDPGDQPPPGRPADPKKKPKEPPEIPWKVQPDPAPKREAARPNLAGSLPLAVVGVMVYPTDPDSPFVAMTPVGAKDRNTVQVYDYRQMKAVGAPIRGRFDAPVPKLALSPDGKYFAAVLPDTRRPTAEVYAVADGSVARRLEVDTDPEVKIGAFDFVADNRLLTAKHRGESVIPETHTDYQVWDVATGKKTAEFGFDLVLDWRWAALSPGRKYLVLEHTDNDRGYHILAWDLTTGASAGAFEFQGRKEPWGQARGLAFTPDGEKLAMLWRLARSPDCWAKMLVWEVKTGKKLYERTIPRDGGYMDTISVHGGPLVLQWLPDPRDGWLLIDHLIVDVETGVTVGKVGSPPASYYDPEPRRFVDRDHMTAIERAPGGDAFARNLVVVTLPRVKLDAAVRKARSDPAPKPVDPLGVAWQVVPDPAPAAEALPLPKGTIPVNSDGLSFFPDAAGCPYVALTPPGADKNTLQVYDLRRMKAVGAPITGKFDAGFQQVKVSADGAYLATPAKDSRTAVVEVFSVATGRVARKVEVDQDPQLKLALFDFVGKDRLLTAKKGGSLENKNVFQVWDLTTGEPVTEFVFEGYFEEKFRAVSPGQKYLVVAASNAITGYRFLAWDLTTGRPAGAFAFQETKDLGGQVGCLAFSPSGDRLALLWYDFKNTLRVRCWDVKTARPLKDHALGWLPRGQAAGWTVGGLKALQWLPDGDGWLLFGHFVADYETGALVGRLGGEPRGAEQIVPRYFLDRDHATTTEEDNLGRPKLLTVLTLPRAQIDAEVKKARGDRVPPR
jgi:WD40 repeat protein